MRKYKCFVSYKTIDGKRHWLLWKSESIAAATGRINIIAETAIVSYVRIERL